MTNKRLVLTSSESMNQARRIADALIERKLAACVNIVPHVQSIYRWKGKAEEAEECLCLAVEDGSPDYLTWIEESVE